MKNALYVLTTSIVMGSAVQPTYAAENVPSQEISQEDQIGKDWTLIQEQNGISIYYSEEVIGDERFLSVKFENTTSENIDFIWSLKKDNNAIVITADEMIESIVQLNSFDSKIVDGTYLIELTEGDQFSDCIISIQPTKR